VNRAAILALLCSPVPCLLLHAADVRPDGPLPRRCPGDKLAIAGQDVLEIFELLGVDREAGATDEELIGYSRNFDRSDADRDGRHSKTEYIASEERFARTLNAHDKIQYWAWPATMMRAVTTAYAERDHFQVGKVAMSGGSKNGATPSMAIIHDDRMTAVHATVSPI